MEARLPIKFEEQYLRDVVKRQNSLIKSIADSISGTSAAPRSGRNVDAERVQADVRDTVDWLADRMSVGSRW